MKFLLYSFFIGIINIAIIQHVESKNWLLWFRTMGFIRRQMMTHKPIGLVGKLPRRFQVMNPELKFEVNPALLIDPKMHGPEQADLIIGKGLGIKGYKADIVVTLPELKKPVNYCGIVITAETSLNSAPFSKMQLFWRPPDTNWNMLKNMKTGEDTFFLRMRPGLMTQVVFFDSVPAYYFRMFLASEPDRNINVKMAFLADCLFPDTIVIKNCGEMVDRNVRYATLPFGVPIHIKCPLDCIRHWPCWGYKIYSTDSPICWTATQAFGRYGDGSYTMYKIPAVAYFRQNINSYETHDIYCRRSIVHYEGYTFERQYYEFAKTDYRDIMGA